MKTIDSLAGQFAGSGDWHESNGNSGRYSIAQTTTATSAGFDVTFKHDFDDGSVVEASFTMVWVADGLFRVEIGGSPVGNGYVFGEFCHYHFKIGEAFIQASYHVCGDSLDVFGSSSRNAEGNFIAWRESLSRSTEPAQLLRACEDALRRAQLTSDAAALDGLLDASLVFTGPDGALYCKSDDLDAHRNGWIRITRLDPSEEQVQTLGDSAVVTVRMEMSGLFRGVPFEGAFRYTRVWHRFAGGWRVVSGHVSAAAT